MKLGIEAILGTLLIALCVILGVTFNQSSIEMTNAKQYHSSVIQKLESVNGANAVRDECIAEATEDGYRCTIEDKVDTHGQNCLEVTLYYKIKIPILHIEKEYKVSGDVQIDTND